MRKMPTIMVLVMVMTYSFSTTGADIQSLIKDLGTKSKAHDASEALARIGKPAVPELIKALNDKDRHRGRYAARALRQMGQEAADAIPALSKSLEDPDTETRVYAVEALGKMIQQADEIIPVLQKATRDKHEDVRKAVEAAIKKLQPSHTDKTGIEQRVKEHLNRQAGKKCLSVQLEQESANVYRGFVEFEDGSKVGITVTTNSGELQYSFAVEISPEKAGTIQTDLGSVKVALSEIADQNKRTLRGGTGINLTRVTEAKAVVVKQDDLSAKVSMVAKDGDAKSISEPTGVEICIMAVVGVYLLWSLYWGIRIVSCPIRNFFAGIIIFEQGIVNLILRWLLICLFEYVVVIPVCGLIVGSLGGALYMQIKHVPKKWRVD